MHLGLAAQAALVFVMIFLMLWGIISLGGPLKRLSKWLDQFQRDIQGIKATGADPKNMWQFYLVYRKYKKNELK